MKRQGIAGIHDIRPRVPREPFNRALRLPERTALVTGGTDGIGREIARGLAGQGCARARGRA